MGNRCAVLDPKVVIFAAEFVLRGRDPDTLNAQDVVGEMRNFMRKKCGGYPTIPACIEAVQAVIDGYQSTGKMN